MTLRVLLVDDHAVVREGYRGLLERSGDIAVIAEAATGEQGLAMYREHRPDVVVMDIALPDRSGIAVLHELMQEAPDARVLMFSMYEDAIYADRALKAGARGYITKGSASAALVHAVRGVAAGGSWLSAEMTRELSGTAKSRAPADLSARELEVLRLLVAGHGVREIATMLGVTPKTVANNQTMIRQKLGADTAVQLLQAARRLGIAPGEERGQYG